MSEKEFNFQDPEPELETPEEIKDESEYEEVREVSLVFPENEPWPPRVRGRRGRTDQGGPGAAPPSASSPSALHGTQPAYPLEPFAGLRTDNTDPVDFRN